MSAVRWHGVAPGRLDVLGGVGDYSGSLVLQTPIRATTHVTISPLDGPRLEIASEQKGEITLPLPAATLTDPLVPIDEVRGWMEENYAPHWTRYSLGSFLLFCQDQKWRPPLGMRFGITSNVPVSMGVSSSAALEVATLRALEEASGRRF